MSILKENNVKSSSSNKIPFYMDTHSPYLFLLVAVVAVLILFISLICFCEHRLHVEKFRDLNQKKAKKAQALKDKRNNVTSPLLVSANSMLGAKKSISLASFNNPLMYKNVAINDMEIIL